MPVSAKMHADMVLLIVEDDARIRELAEVAAQRTGEFSTIQVASDGAAALELLRRHSSELPAVILTDLSMPVSDGLEMTRQIRARPEWRELPIVMFSSSNRPNDRVDALAAGCNAFFEKPPSLTGLQSILEETAAIARRTQQARGGLSAR